MLVSEGFSAVGYYSLTEADGLTCDLEYQATATAESSCTECSTAYRIEVGALDFSEGSDCESSGYTSLTGSTLLVGSSGETMYMDSGSGWQALSEGFAEEENGDFFFAIGSARDNEDDEDDAE